MFKYVESFQHAKFDSKHLACLEGQFTAEGTYGYVLVNDHLVPYSFISRMANEIHGRIFEYDKVHSLVEIFGEEFLASLNSTEREVLGACMLLLIEKGDFCLTNSYGIGE